MKIATAFNNEGNRLTVTEQDCSVVTYGYDNIYQLTSETRTGTNAYNITYQYDSAGNRTQMIKNGTTTSYTYNNNNQLLTETTGGVTVTYAYDLNGNLLSKVSGGNTTSYTWDWNNHLLDVSEPGGNTLYEYDGDGTRISKTQSGVKTKYINDVALMLVQVLMETDNTGVVQAIYTYGNGLISMNRAGVNSYYNYDGLGSARQLTNSSGAVTDSYTYDSFGNLIASSGTTANSYGFTGEQQFGEADNLVFLRARYYDSRVGRFMQRDPIGYSAGLNLYTYCGSNPVNWVDPLGLRPPGFEDCWTDCMNTMLLGLPGIPGAICGGALGTASKIAAAAKAPNLAAMLAILPAWMGGAALGCGIGCGLFGPGTPDFPPDPWYPYPPPWVWP